MKRSVYKERRGRGWGGDGGGVLPPLKAEKDHKNPPPQLLAAQTSTTELSRSSFISDSSTGTTGRDGGQRWAGSMETPIDFYRHFSWLRKVRGVVFLCLGPSCPSVSHIPSIGWKPKRRVWRKSSVWLLSSCQICFRFMSLMSSSRSYCFISWLRGSFSWCNFLYGSRAELRPEFVVASRGWCYQMGRTTRQLMAVWQSAAWCCQIQSEGDFICGWEKPCCVFN